MLGMIPHYLHMEFYIIYSLCRSYIYRSSKLKGVCGGGELSLSMRLIDWSKRRFYLDRQTKYTTELLLNPLKRKE